MLFFTNPTCADVMRHDVGFLSFRVGNREEFVLPAWYNTPCKLPKGEKYMQLFNPDSRFSQFIKDMDGLVLKNNFVKVK